MGGRGNCGRSGGGWLNWTGWILFFVCFIAVSFDFGRWGGNSFVGLCGMASKILCGIIPIYISSYLGQTDPEE